VLLIAASSGGGSSIATFAPLLIIVAAFFFLLVRPQRARQRQLQRVQSALALGTQVMTTSGIFATVTALDDEAVTLEIAPGVNARFLRGAIAKVVPVAGGQDAIVELPPDDRPPV